MNEMNEGATNLTTNENKWLFIFFLSYYHLFSSLILIIRQWPNNNENKI